MDVLLKIPRFMEELALDSGKICFGLHETVQGLEMGAVETLIIWDTLETQRFELRHPQTDEVTVVFRSPKQVLLIFGFFIWYMSSADGWTGVGWSREHVVCGRLFLLFSPKISTSPSFPNAKILLSLYLTICRKI